MVQHTCLFVVVCASIDVVGVIFGSLVSPSWCYNYILYFNACNGVRSTLSAWGVSWWQRTVAAWRNDTQAHLKPISAENNGRNRWRGVASGLAAPSCGVKLS